MKCLAALTLLCGTLALNPGTAQDRKSTRPDPTIPKPQRAHYTVRHADPVMLAEVVGVHFHGDATLIATPAGTGNAVLISGSPAAVPEVLKLLEQLDKKPRGVEVEVTLVELPAAKDGKDAPPVDLTKLDALVKDGKGQRIRLATVEGQQVSTQLGGNKAYTTSTAIGGGGFGGKGAVQKSISYQPVGTTVKMLPRVGADNAVSLELSVQESKVRPAEEEGGAPSFDNTTLTTKVNVPAGKPVIAQSVRTEGKAGATVALVVVTARVVDEGTAAIGP